MMRTGKQGIVPQQLTMEAFVPGWGFEGRHRFMDLRVPGCAITGRRLMRMGVGVRGPRGGGGRHQDQPATGHE